ncbi:DUF3817 domain-containing protein [Bacillus sp. 165]|uniref:DUF3817 domain-containing protein n=1 Tax=Bacillus sp. 165 TaxID=1529117 RepID=UPI001ADC3CF7|nr:DUF3817 domain-containing protein [Bacillus sp. 165]MBO9131162.1 DUF3817 domain-containing protein [Bacillus sp. 165]
MLRTAVGRLRAVGFFEGISFLILLGIAMPLKYAAGFSLAVTIVGAAHGFLFILYLLALVNVTITRRWSFGQVTGAFVASLLPFGTFILDSRIRHHKW